MKKTIQQQRGVARVNRAERRQMEFRSLSLDQWLDQDHRVRVVWRYVESLDLSENYAFIRAIDGQPGRNPVDPRILFALWLYATIEGVASARRLAELTNRDIPYMWICGGVTVNRNLLNEFRQRVGKQLEQLLVDSIAVLMDKDLLSLQGVTQDGMVVRANAGSSSFRGQQSLEKSLEVASAHVDNVLNQQPQSGGLDRQQAAQKRSAEDRQQRVAEAIEELEKLKTKRAQNKSKAKSEPRASTTDPESRVMKVASGGFRPSFNVQFSNDSETLMIVGLDVTNQGTDSGLMLPMYQQLACQYNKVPDKYFVDGRFVKQEDITEMAENQTKVYGPIFQEQKQLSQGQDPYAKKRGDSPAMAEFRTRMGTAEAKAEYKTRCLAEFPNADCRNRNLHQFQLRGLIKAKAQVCWNAIAFNFLRMIKLNFLEAVME